MSRIRIELQSNLCASSGDGYATTIDTDIVTDQFGIPYIPARRLKGCLREAAEYIYGKDCIDINAIFGESGNISSGALRIENAKIEDYDSFKKMCVESKLEASRVTDIFTNTFATTAVEENGKAKEDTLRFLRYVSKTKAWNTEQNLVFYADVDIDEQYHTYMENICKALRHIGYKRNRGFGCVKCTFDKNYSTCAHISIFEDIEDDRDYNFTYVIRLNENVMLPSQTADGTVDYISGQAVIGVLAGKYLKKHIADEMFDELFLSGKVRFSNLYVTDDKYQSYLPVPQIFGKTKQSKEVIDLTVTERGTEIVKPLKSGYINTERKVKKPLTERIYHNNLSDKDGGLYVQNCLQSDQLFRGTISGKGSYIKLIVSLLSDGTLAFGRSKTAQYASCSIVGTEISEIKPKKVQAKNGDKLVYLFESDVLIPDDFSGYAVDISSVCNALNLKEENLLPESGLKYRAISGYLSVMRLQRSHVRAIAAGSAIVISCEKDSTIDEIQYIGGRQNDGFGKIRVFRAGNLPGDDVVFKENSKADKTDVNEEIQALFIEMEKDEKMRNAAISYAEDQKLAFLRNWNTSFIGRVTMMLKQSVNMQDFNNRIASIKTKDKRNTADSFVKDAVNKWERDPDYKTWEKQQEYLLIILTLAKYFHKEKKGATAE